MSTRRRVRDERGVVFPSPLVILSLVAVAMAGVAYVATNDTAPTERQISTISRDQVPSSTPLPSVAPPPSKTKKPKPALERGKVYVEVFNNSGITGLAGEVAARASDIGWQVVGSDNWYGTIPATTVYFPPRLTDEAKALALDLGIERTAPAVDPMRGDRLTVILTGTLG